MIQRMITQLPFNYGFKEKFFEKDDEIMLGNGTFKSTS